MANPKQPLPRNTGIHRVPRLKPPSVNRLGSEPTGTGLGYPVGDLPAGRSGSPRPKRPTRRPR